MAGKSFLVLPACKQDDVGNVERHSHAQSGGEEEFLSNRGNNAKEIARWRCMEERKLKLAGGENGTNSEHIVNLPARWLCVCMRKVASKFGREQVVSAGECGWQPKLYSRTKPVPRSQRYSCGTRVETCRYVKRENTVGESNVRRVICSVSCALNVVYECYVCCMYELILQSYKSVRHIRNAITEKWKRCDGSKYCLCMVFSNLSCR
jgi:hypothetical protein